MVARRVIIDGARVHDLDDVHDIIAALPDVPHDYGRNLDALWDTVTGLIEEPIAFVIEHDSVLRTRLGSDYRKFISLLEAAESEVQKAPESPAVTLTISAPGPSKEDPA